MKSTSTFTFNEYEPGMFSFSSHVEVHYCSYCGQKAQRKDVGCSHNNRWDEEIIYFCSCEDAQQEQLLKEELSKAESEVYRLKTKLKDMKKLEDNEVSNKMKYSNELEGLRKKYKIK
ncbi:MAG: hypothetical protein K0R18_500 [Bacillales bacterium]|jgi:hypothetical protein|nr:hypothetical protein [Bacillales bacterium]